LNPKEDSAFFQNQPMSQLKTTSLVTLAVFLNFLAYMFFIYEATAPEDFPCHEPVAYFEKDDSFINNQHFKNKIYPQEYEQPILLALSFFPELKDVPITFQHAHISTTMNCQPHIPSLLVGKRKYLININQNPNFEGILIQNVPFNAQVGVIGHELAHITDYEAGNVLRIIKRGLDYLFPATKKQFEHDIDMLTIRKGLGNQLYDWANYSMYETPHASEKYKQFKQTVYMQPAHIESVFSEIDCY
jgi:hypothetical protein